MSDNPLLGVAALDAASLLGAAMLLRSWRRRRTRPSLVAGVSLLVLASLATLLVAMGVPYRQVIGPTFILALFVVLYSARYDRRAGDAPGVKPPAAGQAPRPRR